MFWKLFLLPLSKNDGGTDNLRNAGMAYCPESIGIVASFLLGLVTKKTPRDKTTLLKTFGLNSGNACYNVDNTILFHLAYPSAT
jgi:hypothetical protein